MEAILKKFDEAKAIAAEAIKQLLSKQEELEKKSADLAQLEGKLQAEKALVEADKVKIANAEKLLKTQAELDRLIDEENQRLQVLENEEKKIRQRFAKRENEIEVKEQELAEERKRLAERAGALEKEKAEYKDKIFKEVFQKIAKEMK